MNKKKMTLLQAPYLSESIFWGKRVDTYGGYCSTFKTSKFGTFNVMVTNAKSVPLWT